LLKTANANCSQRKPGPEHAFGDSGEQNEPAHLLRLAQRLHCQPKAVRELPNRKARDENGGKPKQNVYGLRVTRDPTQPLAKG
jgi:hypothetical protein